MLKNLPRCACLATAVITTAAMAQALANPATTARLSTLPAVDAASPCVQTLAHRYSSKEAISLLQRAKQPTEQPSDETHEVFRLAAELGDRVCLEWWLARMPELIPAGDGRYSALHAAAVAGRTDIVQLLLDKGEHVDVKDEFGWTAAELAALADRPEVVGLLLQAGADPRWVYQGPEGTAGAAIRWRAEPTSAPQSRASICNDPDCVLGRAIETLNIDKARIALERGASLEGDSSAGWWSRSRNAPVCIATHSRAAAILALLLDRGASPRVECWPLRESPLHLAAIYCDQDLINLLVNHGAAAQPDDHGQTPMAVVLNRNYAGDKAIIRLLRHRGVSQGDTMLVFVTPNLLLGAELGLDRAAGNHFLLGVRPEVVLKRPYANWGAGGYAEVATRGWHDILIGGGLVLAPSFFLVPSLGVYARRASESGWNGGVSAGLFLGTHASNEANPNDAGLGKNVGLRLEGHVGAAPLDRSLAVAFQMDLDWLWLAPYYFLAALALGG